MKRREGKVEVAASVETESRRREVQLLINVADPDPRVPAIHRIYARGSIALKFYMTILHCPANESYPELRG
jgi:hypothetical protein